MNKSFKLTLLILASIIILLNGIGQTEAVTSPLFDYSSYYLTLVKGSTLSYNDTNQSWSASGDGNSKLTAFINSSSPTYTIEYSFKHSDFDYVNKANNMYLAFYNLSNIKILDVAVVLNVSSSSYGRIDVQLRNNTGVTNFLNTGTVRFYNQTTAVTHTYTINETQVILYVNGIKNTTMSYTGGIMNISRLVFMGDNGAYHNGSMWNIKVYNKQFNDSEVNNSVNGLFNNNASLILYNPSNSNGCYIPVGNKSITFSFGSLDYCNGSYFNTSLRVESNNTYINVNNSLLYNDFRNETNSAIAIEGGKNNTLENFNITGYDTCIYFTNYGTTGILNDSTIRNGFMSHCDGVAGIFLDGQSNFRIYNVTFKDFGDNGQGSLGSHAIYVSCQDGSCANSGEIYSNYITNTSATGLKFNGQNTIRNILIYRNYIYDIYPSRGDDIGIHLEDVSNFSIYNNTFSTGYNTGIQLNQGTNTSNYANNNYIYNNSFINLTDGVVVRNGTYNNYLRNNYYSGNNLDLRILSNNSIFVNDNAIYKIGNTFNNIMLIFNYTGLFNLSISNYNASLLNQNSQYPFNDVYNVSSSQVLASNVDNYSITLSSGAQISVGDYGSLQIILNGYPSGDITSGSVGFNISIVDPDSVYNFSNVILYDSIITIVNYTTNFSKNFTTNFTISNGGTYYFRVLAYGNNSDSVDSGLYSFTIDRDYGVASCTPTQHKVWIIIPLIILAGLILYMFTAIDSGFFGTIGFMITLVIALQLIVLLIRTVISSC